MRIQQLKVPTNWFTNSPDPGSSLEAYVKGAWSAERISDYLVDDQLLGGGAYKKPLVNELDEHTGIAFAAKDGETLERGFKALHRNVQTDSAYQIKSSNGSSLTVFYIEWNRGTLRHRTQVGAGLSTAAFNTGQALKRFGIAIFPAKGFLQRHGVTLEQFQSISANVERASRDGKMMARGACLYVCLGSTFPTQELKWGRVWRQIGSKIHFWDLKTLTNQFRS